MINEKQDLTEFIKNIIPDSSISSIQTIVDLFQYKKIKKGDLLVVKGCFSDDYFFLSKGLMRTYLYDVNANEITTDFHTAKNIVFEVTSFFKRTQSQVYIQAVIDCEGYYIPYEQLNSLFHEMPTFRDFGRAILVKEFIASKERTISMINQTAEQRYSHLVKSNSEILLSAPLKQIASYLGITDSTLSRIRRDFSKI